jgi:hypothetical protein
VSARPDYRATLLKLSTLAEDVACARGIASALTDLPGSGAAVAAYEQAVREHEHQLRNVEAVMVALWEMRERAVAS